MRYDGMRYYWVLPRTDRYIKVSKMKSSFPKRVNRHSKKWPCNVNAKFHYYLLEKSFFHQKKMHIHVHILMKSSFPKHDLMPLQPRFLDWHLTLFGKELFKLGSK